MDKSVIISVRGTQTIGKSTSGIMELMTEGRYYKKGDTYYITYSESTQHGFIGSDTTIEVSDGIMKFQRSGMINAQFIFQQGKKHMSHYDTPHGSFTISIYTNNINIGIDDNGGEINIDYELAIDNGHAAVNDFCVKIHEPGKKTGLPSTHFFSVQNDNFFTM